jgi:septal ring factor EnvC (AmiA/AmiB activator)
MDTREIRNRINELSEDLEKVLDRLRELKENYYEIEENLDKYEANNTEEEEPTTEDRKLYNDYLGMLDLVLLVKEEAQQLKWDYEKKYRKDTEE